MQSFYGVPRGMDAGRNVVILRRHDLIPLQIRRLQSPHKSVLHGSISRTSLFQNELMCVSPPDGDIATHFSVIFPPPYFQYGHTISARCFIDFFSLTKEKVKLSL
jgi:hypothetical protein